MQLLDKSIADGLADLLKTRGNLDIEKISTMKELAMLELELKVIFDVGANILIRRLHAGLQEPVGEVIPRSVSTPTGALQNIR